MDDPLRLAPLTVLPAGVEALRAEAAEGGFRFMEQLDRAEALRAEVRLAGRYIG